jgi:hypothetical protein
MAGKLRIEYEGAIYHPLALSFSAKSVMNSERFDSIASRDLTLPRSGIVIYVAASQPTLFARRAHS